MLPQPQVQRFSAESCLRDIMMAEKEVVLTYLLQFLSKRGVLDRFAFKGGTCLRKMVIGSPGRFSTDLDFTALEEHDHEMVILDTLPDSAARNQWRSTGVTPTPGPTRTAFPYHHALSGPQLRTSPALPQTPRVRRRAGTNCRPGPAR